MRRAISNTILKAIISLVLIGIVLSTSFYFYASFLRVYVQSQVNQAFEKFIKPIKDVCEGKPSSESTNIVLPINDEYTYGIFQTKLNYEPNMPIEMRKCTDSYCVCLFRIKNENYNFWSTPTPLWHFNLAGPQYLPYMVSRMTNFFIAKIVSQSAYSITPFIIGNVVCTSSTGNPILCYAATYAGIMAIAGAVRNAFNTFFNEMTEPLLVINYPANFFSTTDPNYLNWKGECNDADFSEDGDCYYDPIRISKLTYEDFASIGFSALSGAISGAIDGFVMGFTRGLKIKEADISSKLSKYLIKVVVKPLVTNAAKTGNIGSIYFRKLSGIYASRLPMLNSFRPKAYVRTLLDLRREIDMDKFVSGDVDIGYSIDESVKNFKNLDIISCVKISDLGPKCNSSTKILMDYGYEFYTQYSLVDPLNFPEKAIFCGYNSNKQDFNIDILKEVTDPLINSIDDDLVRGAVSIVRDLVNVILGDWILQGATKADGSIMECVIPYYHHFHRSEYFQMWIAYPDKTGYYPIYGAIPLMKAYFTSGDVKSCQKTVLDKWKSCILNFEEKTGLYTYPTLTYEEILKTESNYIYNNEDSKIAVCPWDGYSEECVGNNWETNISCTDIYHPKYLACLNGIHVKFEGVLQ